MRGARRQTWGEPCTRDGGALPGALAAVEAHFGAPPDVLVLNSGRSQRALALETELAATRALLELNFFAPVALARLYALRVVANAAGDAGGGDVGGDAAAGARAARSGHVVLTSSLSGKIGTPVASSYSASKCARARARPRGLRREYVFPRTFP